MDRIPSTSRGEGIIPKTEAQHSSLSNKGKEKAHYLRKEHNLTPATEKGGSSETSLIPEDELHALRNLWQKKLEGLLDYMDYKWGGGQNNDGIYTRLLTFIRLQVITQKIGKKKGCIFIVSNRGPEGYQRQPSKQLIRVKGAGGVSVALSSIKNYGRVSVEFVSAPMSQSDREAMTEKFLHNFVSIEEKEYNKYYNKISNDVLWFILHGMEHSVQSDVSKIENNWESYTSINQKFADTVSAKIREEQEQGKKPIVMIQDYHLLQASRMLREKHQNTILQHFIHIPWPKPEVWNQLPLKIVEDIHKGMSGNDIIGFQTKEYATNFLQGVQAHLSDAVVNFEESTVRWNGRNTQVRVYPISIAVDEIRAMANNANSESAKQDVNDEKKIEKPENIQGSPEMKKIVSVDRIDPTKNTLRLLQAYGLLLNKHPEWCGKVIFKAYLVPSREMVPIYRNLRRDIEALINQINKEYGTKNWMPIHAYFGNNQARAVAAMESANVMAVVPEKDGMNMVAKEAVSVMSQGVLVLSMGAGSMEELEDGVVVVEDPKNIEAIADRLYVALAMSPEECQCKTAIARKVVEEKDLFQWLLDQFRDLHKVL